jgi:Tfp pilus assembly protein PilX
VKNGKEEFDMKRHNEKGTAMLFAIILVLVLSVMAASMMFLSQSETWGSMNYRMMTQTRYGAEAGVHAAANFLLNTYVPPAALAGYNMTVPTPAACGNTPCVTDNAGNAIVLSSLSGVPSNYPDAVQLGLFKAATNSSVQAGNTAVNYTVSAKLLSMQQITQFGTNQKAIVQTWQITGHGDIAGVRSAESEVSAILETPKVPTFGYAAFGDGAGCGTLNFSGNGTTDSYDSGALPLVGGVATPPSTFNTFGGNLGTNGNQTNNGSNVTVNGSLSTPDIGLGVCTAGNVTALTGQLSQIKGGLIQLPAPVAFPTPTTYPPGSTNITTTQTLGPCVLSPCPYGDITLSGKDNVTLQPGTYNINSVSLSGQATITIAPDPITGLYGPVIINVAGIGQSTPINLVGQGFSNPTLDPSIVQITYAGMGLVKIAGNGASAACVYAPNATASFAGNASFYGSVIANTLTDVGNGAIHYDLRLKRKLYTVGTPTLNSFTWSKF